MMVFFSDSYIMRRYEKESYVNGYPVPGTFADSYVTLDVQPQFNGSVYEDSGGRDSFPLEVYSDYAFRVARQEEGVRADLIYYDGRWYECTQCRESFHLLPHWTSTFTLVPHSKEPDPAVSEEEDSEEGSQEDSEEDSDEEN